MNTKYLKSLAELVFLTYVTALLGLVTADGFDLLSLSGWKTAAAAALPSVAAAVYGAFARLVGNFNSAVAVDTRDGV